MRRLWMHTLTGQLIALMLLALVLSLATTLLITRNERDRVVLNVRRDDFLSRAASISGLIAETDESLRPQILNSVSSSFTRYWITTEPAGDPQLWEQTARKTLLQERPLPSGPPEVRENARRYAQENQLFAPGDLKEVRAVWEPLSPQSWSGGFHAQLMQLKPWNGFGLTVKVKEGLYLNTISAKPDDSALSFARIYLSFGITALALSFACVLVARRVGRPLQSLADSADRLGRGEEALVLPEEGADDIQRTAAAFNRMQARIRRFVEDRTQMIAGVSHDLRTPITSLRLRAEFIQEPEMREKIIATLDEMHAMTEAALAFAREESVIEPSRTVDLDALLESLCADLADLGWAVTCADGERTPYRCRPDGLKRALRNLIENAVRYGGHADVRLTVLPEWLEINIEDSGPGIAEKDFERAFAPFVRLESSRNRSTGGVGLGLSIARTIVRSHGGDIHLHNIPQGGLRVVMQLPRK